jgi:deoxyribonuclease V
MGIARPDLRPDPALDRDAMAAQQRRVARAATFADDVPLDPSDVALADPLSLPDGVADADPTDGPWTTAGEGPPTPLQATLGDGPAATDAGAPTVVGVDQAFLEERALGAAVAVRDGRVVEVAAATAPLAMPYVPGLLSFREGEAVLAALAALSADPGLLVVDGSGRIHYRQAGLATHLGAALDTPAVGVAKSLLCGRPARSLEDPLPAGVRVPIRADGDVEATDGTTIGHAVQTRQFDSDARHVNPVYVSPGHRVGAATAADLVTALAAGYKLPEPTRLADRAADLAKPD